MFPGFTYDQQGYQVPVCWCTCAGVSPGHWLFRFLKAKFFIERAKKKRKKPKVGGVELAFFRFSKEGWDMIKRKKRQMKAGKCQGTERSQVCMLFFNQAQVGLRKTVGD